MHMGAWIHVRQHHEAAMWTKRRLLLVWRRHRCLGHASGIGGECLRRSCFWEVGSTGGSGRARLTALHAHRELKFGFLRRDPARYDARCPTWPVLAVTGLRHHGHWTVAGMGRSLGRVDEQ